MEEKVSGKQVGIRKEKVYAKLGNQAHFMKQEWKPMLGLNYWTSIAQVYN